MIRVRIGDSERELRDATPQWVNEQINRRRADGLSVCVQVVIRSGPLDITLVTPTCPGTGGGGGRHLNRHEKDVVSLWKRLHLDTQDFTGGNLVAFLRQIS